MSILLSVQDVTVRFDGFTVLDHLDFAVDVGELRFLIGPNGAGKTTLLDVITGRIRPVAGAVLFDGANVSAWPEHKRALRGIGRKFQTPSVFPTLSVFENLEATLSCRSGTASLFGPLPSAARERVEAVLEQVGLAERRHTRAGTLAHGEMQWLEIGMLLVQDSRLLLLDEPIAGMTRPERDRTGHLLESLADQHSVVVVEHDMEFMRQFARQVTVLHLGTRLMEGDVETVQNDPRVREIYLGPKRDRGVTRERALAGAK